MDDCRNCPQVVLINEKLDNMVKLQDMRDIEQETTTKQIGFRLGKMEKRQEEQYNTLNDSIKTLENNIPRIISNIVNNVMGRFAKWFLAIVIGGGFIFWIKPLIANFFDNLFR